MATRGREPKTRSPIDLLLKSLNDPDANVRAATVQALVRLRLPDPASRLVAEYMVRTLAEGGTASRDELRSCIDCAALYHQEAVVDALSQIASGPDKELADLAVDALVRARDNHAIPALLRRLRSAEGDDGELIARKISILDIAPYVAEVEEAYSAVASKSPSETGFWLALALARAGRPVWMAALVTEIATDEHPRLSRIGAWLGDELTAGGRLSPQSLETIRAATGKDSDSDWRTMSVLAALERAAAEPPHPSTLPAAPVPAPHSSARRRTSTVTRGAARIAPLIAPNGRLRVRVAGAVARVVGQPAMVSAAFEQAARINEPTLLRIAANSILEHVDDLPGFEPDVLGLFHVYRLGVHPDQIAWTAARRPITGVLDDLHQPLAAADATMRADAARFIAEVADQSAAPFPPMLAWGKGAGGPATAAASEPEQGEVEGAPLPPSEERVVSTGFARVESPDDPLSKDRALAVNSDYWYWFEIGEATVTGRIEDSNSPIDVSKLPSEALLTIVIFPFEGGLETIGGSVGRLKLEPTRQISMEAQPEGPQPAVSRFKDRLFFMVRTPATPGIHGMRVSMYCQNILVQSRRVTVRISAQEADEPGSLKATVDYTISHSLDFVRIASRRGNRLSLMVNGQDDGGHGFLFVADKEKYYCPAWFSEHELDEYVMDVRKALRTAAYGHDGRWVKSDAYQYENPTLDQLCKDLKALAIAGKRVHANIVSRLACHETAGADAADSLIEMMRTPGQIEIANRISPTLILPAAVIYDQPLDDGVTDLAKLSVCQDFIDVVKAKGDLASHPCFNGNCANSVKQRDDRVVCPGNFWGYRHSLGLPISVSSPDQRTSGDEAKEASAVISYDAMPQFDIGFATGADLVLRDDHLNWIQGNLGVSTARADSRESTFSLFKTSRPHVFYFYCHGGISKSMVPYLQVGANTEDPITPNNVTDRVRWAQTRPLVFINGCHTTALEPTQAIQFVTAFVENGHASGVIGTEITVFEPLATEFAQVFFSGVLLQNMNVGEAVRAARLQLLAQMNPLGLAYVPFAAPDLEFKKLAAPASERVAVALLNNGGRLFQLGRWGDALDAYEQVFKRYGEAAEPPPRDEVVKALVGKGASLLRLGRSADALDAYEQVIKRSDEAAEPRLRDEVVMALVGKGVSLLQLNRWGDAIKALDQLIEHYGQATGPVLNQQVASALYYKGMSLAQLDRPADAITAYNQVIERSGEAPDLGSRQLVALALLNTGLSLEELDRLTDAITAYDQVIERCGHSEEPELRGPVANALLNKGGCLGELNRAAEELAAYDEVIERYSESRDPTLREIVAEARNRKSES